MLGRGKKTREWDRVRAKLKIRFEAAGITRCEFGYDGCWRSNGLSFAHYDKRRFLSAAELEIAALACASCHPKLEILPRKVMKAEVCRVIRERICQP